MTPKSCSGEGGQPKPSPTVQSMPSKSLDLAPLSWAYVKVLDHPSPWRVKVLVFMLSTYAASSYPSASAELVSRGTKSTTASPIVFMYFCLPGGTLIRGHVQAR